MKENTSLMAGLLLVVAAIAVALPAADGLGSMSTVAVAYGTGTVCGIRAGKRGQGVECVVNERSVKVAPDVSFDGISGGRDFLCGLRFGGSQLLCWDIAAALGGNGSSTPIFRPRRIYNNASGPLAEMVVGEGHVCAVRNATEPIHCWRPLHTPLPFLDGLQSITAGRGFSCGILENRRVACWAVPADDSAARVVAVIESGFSKDNAELVSIFAGESHACGITVNGTLVCHGKNDSGQLNASPAPPFGFSSVALGRNWTCAVRRSNGTVACWGRGMQTNYPSDTSFEWLVSGDDFACGLSTGNFSVICWGPNRFNPARAIPLPQVIPGRCRQQTECQCGTYPDSENLCSASRLICGQCSNQSPPPPPPLQPPPTNRSSPPTNRSSIWKNRSVLALGVIGCVGAFSGLVAVVYCIWSGICCCKHQKIYNSVQPTIGNGGNPGTTTSPSKSSSIVRRQSSLARMRRQRSGTSSTKQFDHGAEEFFFTELLAATNGFAEENWIGDGSFGTVYRGKLADGREVAIKRGEIGLKKKIFQEKETAFVSELAFLSRLHHKHLVSLVGFCDELEEKLLVYEFMHNGALYDHLHRKNVPDSPINSWRMRIQVALDAARGIEYLHNYAVPPIIHRDIKSSNILLDARWTARVSDFGLSLRGTEVEGSHLNLMAAGTVGYMDPEYYGLQHLTTKSDVYGFGVVLLEMLTGKKAIHKDEEAGTPVSVVDLAVGRIIANELPAILDRRLPPPQGGEAEAVELVAYTAVHCVHLEGRDRPTMADVVTNLERAISMFSEIHGNTIPSNDSPL